MKAFSSAEYDEHNTVPCVNDQCFWMKQWIMQMEQRLAFIGNVQPGGPFNNTWKISQKHGEAYATKSVFHFAMVSDSLKPILNSWCCLLDRMQQMPKARDDPLFFPDHCGFRFSDIASQKEPSYAFQKFHMIPMGFFTKGNAQFLRELYQCCGHCFLWDATLAGCAEGEYRDLCSQRTLQATTDKII